MDIVMLNILVDDGEAVCAHVPYDNFDIDAVSLARMTVKTPASSQLQSFVLSQSEDRQL